MTKEEAEVLLNQGMELKARQRFREALEIIHAAREAFLDLKEYGYVL